jgi:hypothetical protein
MLLAVHVGGSSAAACLPLPCWNLCTCSATNWCADSTAQLEFVYNNGGYIGQTQSDLYFGTWDDIEPADTLQTFQKPPGEPACASCRRCQTKQTGLRAAWLPVHMRMPCCGHCHLKT